MHSACRAGVAEQADALDLKSNVAKATYRFDPGHRHHIYRGVEQLVARRAHNPEAVWFKSHLRNQQVAPKKISGLKTQKPQRFLGFFMPILRWNSKDIISPNRPLGRT